MTTEAIQLTAAVDLQAAPATGKRPTFSIRAYTGGPMRVADFYHPVVLELAGMTSGETLPIFLAHDAGAIVGQGQPSIDSEVVINGVVTGDTGPAAEVVGHAKNGFRWQASIGATITRREFLAAGKTTQVNGRDVTGPMIIGRQSELFEVSFVPIGADRHAAAHVAATSKGAAMPETTVATADTPELERARLISKYTTDFPERGDRFAVLEARADAESWEADRLEVELIRASRPTGPRNFGSHTVTAAGNVIEAALCLAGGLSEDFVGQHFDEPTMNAATSKQYRGYGIHDVFAEVIRAAGKHAGTRFTADTIRTAFEADRALRASGWSTISLPGILGNVANKSMFDAFQAVNTTWPLFCAIESNSDFKQATRYRLTGSGAFEKVGAAGELKHQSLQESSFTSQLDTYGMMLALTRQDIINDDLGALQQIPRIIGRASAVALEKAVYTLLLSNPGNFFETGVNLLTAALDLTSLGTAEALFLDQVDANGDPILSVPGVLLVASDLRKTAFNLVNSTEVNEAATAGSPEPSGNPFFKRFVPAASPYISSQNLSGASTTQWYLLAKAGDLAIQEVAFLDGRRAPTIESGDTSFETLGMQWRGYYDFATSMRDRQAGVKSTGAG